MFLNKYVRLLHVARNKTLLAILFSGVFWERWVQKQQRQGTVSLKTGRPQGEAGYCAGYDNTYSGTVMVSLQLCLCQSLPTNLMNSAYLLLLLLYCLYCLLASVYLHFLRVSPLLSILMYVDSFWSSVEIS